MLKKYDYYRKNKEKIDAKIKVFQNRNKYQQNALIACDYYNLMCSGGMTDFMSTTEYFGYTYSQMCRAISDVSGKKNLSIFKKLYIINRLMNMKIPEVFIEQLDNADNKLYFEHFDDMEFAKLLDDYCLKHREYINDGTIDDLTLANLHLIELDHDTYFTLMKKALQED